MGCRSWKQPHRLSGILSTSLNLKMGTAKPAKGEWPVSSHTAGQGHLPHSAQVQMLGIFSFSLISFLTAVRFPMHLSLLPQEEVCLSSF